MAKILESVGRTFSEYSLLTGLTKKDCLIPDISLETKLGENLIMRTPFLSAAMTSVTGEQMVLALGREGGMGVIPARLNAEEQARIVKAAKTYEMGFVEDPIKAPDYFTIEEVLRMIEKHGHSRIPIIDKNNVFKGVFEQKTYWEKDHSIRDPVVDAMIPFGSEQLFCINDVNISIEDAKIKLKEKNKDFLIVLDGQNRLEKLAFQKDMVPMYVGAAISTHEGWKEKVAATIEAGVDLIVSDSSDGYSEFSGDLIVEYKKTGFSVPLCVGNVITYEGAMYLMESGADIVKPGMSSGSICTTQKEKATGRGPMTALIETVRARDDFKKKTGKHVYVIADGGIPGSADMIVALGFADAIMMGNYFNKFYEAAANKLDERKKVTTHSSNMKFVETWGEGSDFARNLDRYGHNTRKTFFAEGIKGEVPYKGRLKPNMQRDILKIKAALSNAGAHNLAEFREKAVFELNSPHTSQIVSTTHDVYVVP